MGQVRASGSSAFGTVVFPELQLLSYTSMTYAIAQVGKAFCLGPRRGLPKENVFETPFLAVGLIGVITETHGSTSRPFEGVMHFEMMALPYKPL